MSSNIPEQVAFVLCPPHDGWYDDEKTQTRFMVMKGLITWRLHRGCLLTCTKNVWHLTEHERAAYLPWGTYRMLPE